VKFVWNVFFAVCANSVWKIHLQVVTTKQTLEKV